MKRLPTGWDDFERVIKGDYYYVDKTRLVNNLIQTGSAVTLFTRPRRFGKTLNMSMLKNFFEIGSDPSLFDGLEITKNKVICNEYMGKYPVISISLKGVSGLTYEEAKNKLAAVIATEAMRFSFLEDSSKLSERDKALYEQLVKVDDNGKSRFDLPLDVLSGSLYTMTELLNKHYGLKAVVLIDEYDVPLDKAYIHGYYDEMVELIRDMFHAAFKTNSNLAFAVLTGCLRVSKESIFTGLNNMKVDSISMLNSGETFGFSNNEVEQMLAYYGISENKDEVKAWYDGFRFGDDEVYCPWDVINYVDDNISGVTKEPNNYWINSSGNDLVREFVDISTKETIEDLEKLVSGEKVKKSINENLTYRDMDSTIDNLWGILYATGYLTGIRTNDNLYDLWIPNKEVRQIYEENIIKWFNKKVREDASSKEQFYNAALSGNAEEMEGVLNGLLFDSVSIRDTYTRKYLRENFYHGFVLGLLTGFEGIRSNSESGDGYSDIMILDRGNKTAAILELKYADSDDVEVMEKACNAAIKQIVVKKYDKTLIRSGVAKNIYKYGISFNKKLACVRINEQ
ncbi:MAG: AAA family ATPase [Catonella sp.]|nr:AAA family ATPase [Catonella sp.]MDY6356297.1 AAA family ATPase [Catonella sp.]